MNRTSKPVSQEEWLNVLTKGMLTLPKKWREELGITEGDIVKAKKEGNRVVIEPRRGKEAAYRTYTDREIDEFLQADKLPRALVRKVKADIASRAA